MKLRKASRDAAGGGWGIKAYDLRKQVCQARSMSRAALACVVCLERGATGDKDPSWQVIAWSGRET